MNKEFKGFREGYRYLVKDESKFWDTSFEIIEIYILEISEKAVKIKYENNYSKWYLKETFNFSMIENLSVNKQTIEDRSKREWQKNPPKELMSWYEADEYAKNLGEGWRLPTREELKEAYDFKIEGFQSSSYWSSSTNAQNTNTAWYVYFYNGHVYLNYKTDNGYVRCVRDTKNPKQTIEDRSHGIQFDDDWKGNEYDATLKLE